MSTKIKSTADLESKILSIIRNDSEEKKNFEKDPKVFINTKFDLNLPENLKVKVVRYAPQELVLSIPKVSTEPELSEEELDTVSGGSEHLACLQTAYDCQLSGVLTCNPDVWMCPDDPTAPPDLDDFLP